MAAPPQHYAMINGHSPEAPFHPGYKPKSGRRTCLWCLCCCCSVLLLLLVLFIVIPVYFYIIYKPQAPSYNVLNFEVKALNFQPDFSLFSRFLVTVKTDNPNSDIGFIYGDGSAVEVVYSGSQLCAGKLPSFYQGHRNMTLIAVELTGKSEFGSGLQEALMDSRKNHKVPLLVKVRVPVRVVIGEFRLRQMMVLVNCSLVVDNLAPNKKIGILSSNTTFNVEF